MRNHKKRSLNLFFLISVLAILFFYIKSERSFGMHSYDWAQNNQEDKPIVTERQDLRMNGNAAVIEVSKTDNYDKKVFENFNLKVGNQFLVAIETELLHWYNEYIFIIKETVNEDRKYEHEILQVLNLRDKEYIVYPNHQYQNSKIFCYEENENDIIESDSMYVALRGNNYSAVHFPGKLRFSNNNNKSKYFKNLNHVMPITCGEIFSDKYDSKSPTMYENVIYFMHASLVLEKGKQYDLKSLFESKAFMSQVANFGEVTYPYSIKDFEE